MGSTARRGEVPSPDVFGVCRQMTLESVQRGVPVTSSRARPTTPPVPPSPASTQGEACPWLTAGVGRQDHVVEAALTGVDDLGDALDRGRAALDDVDEEQSTRAPGDQRPAVGRNVTTTAGRGGHGGDDEGLTGRRRARAGRCAGWARRARRDSPVQAVSSAATTGSRGREFASTSFLSSARRPR